MAAGGHRRPDADLVAAVSSPTPPCRDCRGPGQRLRCPGPTPTPIPRHTATCASDTVQPVPWPPGRRAPLPNPAALIPFGAARVRRARGSGARPGRRFGGVPAVYETTLRPAGRHAARPGSRGWMPFACCPPGCSSGFAQHPRRRTLPVHRARQRLAQARTLVAAFNGGFPDGRRARRLPLRRKRPG